MLTEDDRIGAAWWHEHTDRRPLVAVFVTGLMATVAAVLAGYLLPAVGLPTVAWPLSDGELVAPYDEFGTAAPVAVGFAVTLATGTLVAFLYGLFVQPRIGVMRPVGQVVVGLALGAVFAIALLAFVLPLVYARERGYGVFMASGPDGWRLPVSVLVTMLVYGGLVGLLFQPRALARVTSERAEPVHRAPEM